jgi:hypothetical protein
MSTIIAASGTDTWVRDDLPNRNQGTGVAIRLQSTHRRGLVHIPVTDIRGRTVLSATLTGVVRAGFVAQTITAKPIAAGWSAGRVTWNNQPATTGAGVATVLSATADQTAVVLNVTSLLQSVANGTAWRGVQLTTTATVADTGNFNAYDSAQPAWTLTVELSDAPEQPTDLRPDVGAVGSPRPILAWSYTDLGAGSTEQGAFRVQVDAAGNFTTPAFDTGFVTSGDPQYDLSSGTFTALASGASTQWRVMTRDGDGNVSIWSDPATFSYRPSPVLVMDSPVTGTIGDPTPDVIAHMTGETMTQWRVRVLDAADNVRWDTGRRDGPLSITVPERNSDGDRVIHRDDATYTFDVRAWGSIARAVAVGLPAYVAVQTNVLFDDDIGVVVPTNFAAAAPALGDPRITFSWDRTTPPVAAVILDNGAVYARLDSDDWTLNAGHYTWTDRGYADPYVQHSYTIRALDVVSGNRKRSKPSNTVNYTPVGIDVWLVPDDGSAPIRFETKASIDSFVMVDRRATFKPLNRNVNVSIVYGQEGVSGTFTGLLSAQQNQVGAVSRLKAIRSNPYARPRLVWGISVPVEVSNVKILPAADYTAAQAVWNVSFDFMQAGS